MSTMMVDELIDADWVNALQEQWYRNEEKRERRRLIVIVLAALLGLGAAVWGIGHG